MKKLSVKPKRIAQRVGPQWDDVACDDGRRLRNALMALAEMDKGWIAWVERYVPRSLPVRAQRVIVERRARALVAGQYSFMPWASRAGLIYSDYYFTDEGALKTYL